MELTIIGKSPAMPDTDGANSGYLFCHDGFTLLVDCGAGVFSKLRKITQPTGIDAVLITHLHADHTTDLLPFSHALNFRYPRHDRRPMLWAPPGSERAFRTLSGIFGSDQQIAGAFELAEYEPDSTFELGPLRVSLAAVPHYVPTWACDLCAGDGKRVTFGADCAPNDAIVRLARDTDLLMLEATEGPEPPEPDAEEDVRGHMSSREAGELARRAGAKRLVLTHFSSELDAAELRGAAEASFGATVELAREGAKYRP